MATNETVSKTKGGDAAPTVEVNQPVATPQRKTFTNWKLFEVGGFIPVRIRCDGYLGQHPSDLSCHGNLLPTSEAVIRHMDPAHSGGWFRFKFRISDGKTSPIWSELEDAGVEIQHLYCPHCREEVKMTPRSIIHHLQAHAGANRVNLDPQVLCMTLGYNRPEDAEYEGLYETSNG